jgi:predicted RNase H-like nuclease (RuvC/YqgF family)
LQKIWDANGAAIYEANQEYQAKHGKEMDAGSRSKAIKDATVNGVFNAGAYASNLETAKTRQEAQNERMANKMTRVEREEEVRWQASQKAAEEKQKAEELQVRLSPPIMPRCGRGNRKQNPMGGSRPSPL